MGPVTIWEKSTSSRRNSKYEGLRTGEDMRLSHESRLSKGESSKAGVRKVGAVGGLRT